LPSNKKLSSKINSHFHFIGSCTYLSLLDSNYHAKEQQIKKYFTNILVKKEKKKKRKKEKNYNIGCQCKNIASHC